MAIFGMLAAALLGAQGTCQGDGALMDTVKLLCRDYLDGFGSADTGLLYHHRLNGPRALQALESPEEITKGRVRGKEMPYGYGSGVQDVALENGQLLIALCEAYEATEDEFLAETARRIFSGLKLVATVSPVPGFVPRGPHPDGKSYYRDSSMDQHTTFVYALWRYSRAKKTSSSSPTSSTVWPAGSSSTTGASAWRTAATRRMSASRGCSSPERVPRCC